MMSGRLFEIVKKWTIVQTKPNNQLNNIALDELSVKREGKLMIFELLKSDVMKKKFKKVNLLKLTLIR